MAGEDLLMYFFPKMPRAQRALTKKCAAKFREFVPNCASAHEFGKSLTPPVTFPIACHGLWTQWHKRGYKAGLSGLLRIPPG